MRLKRKKSYIDVEPSTIDVDNLLKDTTRVERFRIFEVLASMRKHLFVLLMISGALSTFFAVQFALGFQVFLSPLSLVALGVVGFIGVVNIICGLLLLASE
jgi:hypothetical protein